MANPGPIGVEALLAHREWARGLARALVRDPADADDLEQAAWLEAIRRPPARDEGLRGWLATLLRRRARDRWRADERRGRREEAAARPESVRPTAEIVAEAEAHRLVVEALMAIEEPFREALLLRFFEDLEPREVSARLGVPVETVRSRTRRGIERLRERLDAGRPGGRTAWMAALAPLAGLRGEAAAAAAAAGGGVTAAGAAAGGAVMGTKAAAGAAVIGALAGAVAGGVAVGTVAGGASEESIEAARAEVRVLRGRIEAIEGTATAPGGASPGGAATVVPASVERLEAQERRIAALEEAVRPGSAGAARAPEAAGAPAPASGDEEERRAAALRREAEALEMAKDEAAMALGKEEARRLFLDRSKPDEERAVALGRLRSLRGMDREVIAEACAMFRASTKPGIREWLLRDFHGTKDPDLKAVFLEAMRSDPDEKVRERAARDVDDYLDDPEVRQALERVRDQDASESVRRRAVRTLASGPRKDPKDD
jgi:RNA polymerase sigma-70 factor (ECF subfamily)